MYHIRRADNGDERSLHQDTMEGLEAAIVEAGFRSAHTQTPHEIYDDVRDEVVTIVSQWIDGVPPAPSITPKHVGGSDWFLMSLIGVLAFAIVCRLFIFR